jgi:outer membrane receptor protein involved in Fe transport
MSNSLEDGSPIFAAASKTNAGRVNTQGIELGLKYFLNKHLSAYINYNWFDFDVKEESMGTLILPNTPEHRISFGASYTLDRLDISMRYRWVDNFHWANGIFNGIVNSYDLVDLTSNIYFSNGFSFGVNISNLFNTIHYQLFGGDILHRRALATISYRW